jgi:hypothetical protein
VEGRGPTYRTATPKRDRSNDDHHRPVKQALEPSAIDPCATAVDPSPTATVYFIHPPPPPPRPFIHPPPPPPRRLTQPAALASGADASQVAPKAAAAIAAPDHFPRLRRKRRRFTSSLPSSVPVTFDVSLFIEKIELMAGYYVSFLSVAESPGRIEKCIAAIMGPTTATLSAALNPRNQSSHR